MTYSEAIQFLYRLQLFGAKLGLDTTRHLAAAAGNPDRSLRFIHVAGTNGKGSTCAMLESMYRGAGLKVGLYTSPHLVSFRERIQVNRALISEEDVVRLVQEAQRWIATLDSGVTPTFFEVITVIALRYFAEQKVDLVIWETGLGGRLDATNVVTPLASIITNVQLDHERWLGSTTEEIAREKAGIIKPRVPVFTAAADPSALRVIQAAAAQNHAPLTVISLADAARLPCAPALEGEHQRLNAALAITVVDALRQTIPVSQQALQHGLSEVQWIGRFQIIQRDGKTIVLDGAHNPAGAAALADAVRSRFADRSLTLVMGVLDDKKWASLCSHLAPLASRILVAPVASPRSAEPKLVAEECRAANPTAPVSTAESLAQALQSATPDALVLVTGSLYFIGEALEILGLGTSAGERGLNDYTAQAEIRKP